MALVKPDLSDVQEDITPGTYKVRVRKGDVKSWDSGTTYINWEMETFGETEPKNNGRRIFHKTPCTGKGAFLLQKFYRAATNQPLTGEFDTEQLVGKEVVVEVVEGKDRQTGAPTGYTEIRTVRPVQSASMN